MIFSGWNRWGRSPLIPFSFMGWCGMPRAVMLSKSQGNGVDPLDIIEKYGADALRFSLLHRQRARQRYALFR